MNIKSNYYSWFQKLISVLIDIFFYWASIVTIYVFVSSFSGIIKYVLFALLLVIYGLVIYFFKDKIKIIIDKLLNSVSRLDVKKMIIIISLLMIVSKIVYTILFYFDATSDSDIKIYNFLAQYIVDSGEIFTNTISHLFGTAIHFVIFKLLHIPLHIGMFIFILSATLINFLSFKDIVGKDKAFLTVMAYIIMPSTSMLSLSPTHEIFVYTYLSFFVYLLNKLLRHDDKELLYGILLILDIFLLCLVNPVGMITYVILGLLIILSDFAYRKKIALIIVLVLSILCSNIKDNYLNASSSKTSINTYTILIHGSNPESLGEQVDGYPLDMMKKYLDENGMERTDDNYVIAGRKVLMDHYLYLISHPLVLIKLIVHKTYILWSGDHYALEMGHHFNAYGNIVYYGFLLINTLIYLIMITVGWAYKTKKDCEVGVNNYKLAILGTIAVTMISIVLNKYDLYITLFIYFIAIYYMRSDDDC